MKYYSYNFAQAYGEGSYGECTYSGTEEQQSTGACAAATGGSNGGGLADTGVAIAAIVTLACLLIFVALVVRIWRRPRAVPQEAGTQHATTPSRQSDDQ